MNRVVSKSRAKISALVVVIMCMETLKFATCHADVKVVSVSTLILIALFVFQSCYSTPHGGRGEFLLILSIQVLHGGTMVALSIAYIDKQQL